MTLPDSRIFESPQKKNPQTCWLLCPLFPAPSPWQPLIGRLSVSVPTLDTSYEGNPSICGLWERLSFSVFRAHPGGGTLFLFLEECSLNGHLLLRSSVDGQYSAPSLAFSKLTLSCHSHVNVGMALGCGRHPAQHEMGAKAALSEDAVRGRSCPVFSRFPAVLPIEPRLSSHKRGIGQRETPRR